MGKTVFWDSSLVTSNEERGVSGGTREGQRRRAPAFADQHGCVEGDVARVRHTCFRALLEKDLSVNLKQPPRRGHHFLGTVCHSLQGGRRPLEDREIKILPRSKGRTIWKADSGNGKNPNTLKCLIYYQKKLLSWSVHLIECTYGSIWRILKHLKKK